MSFLDIAEDFIVLILTDHCDIRSVVALRVGGTTKYLHRLALDVCLSLVTKLIQRRVTESPPNDEPLDNLPMEQLLDKLKITLNGPRTRLQTHPDRSPSVKGLRKVVKPFENLVHRSPDFMPQLESHRIVLYPHIATELGKTRMLPDDFLLDDRSADHVANRPRMTLYVCELQRGLYRIWLHYKSNPTSGPSCYELVLLDFGVSCHLQSFIRSSGKFPLGILYSGHIVYAADRGCLIPPIADLFDP
ncbi:hypothetical protein C8R43DRAFT_1116981 [Mycena crocata]|nr:hypothetical protein C8R43DRAFT_1116981 [Mycena crocata]